MPAHTPSPSPAHEKNRQCPQRPHQQRPPRSPQSVLAPLAGSFKFAKRRLVFTHFQPHMLQPPLDLGLPLAPALAQQDIDAATAADLALHTLCLQTN